MGSGKKIKISFVGCNSTEVTGSMIWIKTPDRQILLEAGLYQSAGNTLETYKENSKHFKFKPSEIDYVFVNHNHADHLCLAPRLYKEGCTAPLIMPEGSESSASILLFDSSHIAEADADELSRTYSRDYTPLYDDDDIENTLNHLAEYEIGQTVELDEYVKFRFVPSGHILNSAQLELWITCGNITKKLVYTSDLGNVHIKNYYVNEFSPVKKADILIGETTYGGEERIATQRVRFKDLEKLKQIIEDTCINRRARVLIPIFANSRCQAILTHLYDLFGGDKSFRIPILVDSPMAIRVCEAYNELLDGSDYEKWKTVQSWENIKFISDPDESRSWQLDEKPMVVLSTAGMLTHGRSRFWCKALLPNINNCIVFCGFSVENSLASIIKQGTAKTIKLGGKRVSNRCRVFDLHSFSSHMQRDSLLDYYSSVDCEKVLLVHGEMEGKLEFAKLLEEKISKNNKTSKVVCVNKDYSITI